MSYFSLAERKRLQNIFDALQIDRVSGKLSPLSISTDMIVTGSHYLWAGTPVTDGIGLVSTGLIAKNAGEETVNVSAANGGFQFGKTSDNHFIYEPTAGTITSYGITFDDWANVSGANIPEQNADVTPPLPSDEFLVGYWSFNDGSGDVLLDSSSNGNNGTLHNMEDGDWVDGVAGRALNFNEGGASSNEYVSIPHHASLNHSGDFSIAYWIYFNPGSTQQKWSLGKGTPYGSAGAGWGVRHWSTADPVSVNLYVSDGVGSSNHTCAFGSMARGQWHFLVFTVDKTLNEVKTYLNSEYQNTLDISALGSFDSADDLLIGTGNGTSNTSDCRIEEVRNYDTLLSASFIKALHLNPGGLKAPHPGATVGATAGTNLFRSSGSTLDDADVITSQGTADDVEYGSGKAVFQYHADRTSLNTADDTNHVNDAVAENTYDLHIYGGADIKFYSDNGNNATGSINNYSAGAYHYLYIKGEDFTEIRANKELLLTAGSAYTITCAGDTIPNPTNAHDLGGTSNKWNYVYANYLGASGTNITRSHIYSRYIYDSSGNYCGHIYGANSGNDVHVDADHYVYLTGGSGYGTYISNKVRLPSDITAGSSSDTFYIRIKNGVDEGGGIYRYEAWIT